MLLRRPFSKLLWMLNFPPAIYAGDKLLTVLIGL